MRAVLRDLRERGVHLSMLDPFNHAFYRAHGYELAAEALRYTLKPGELLASPEQRHVRAYRKDDLPRMKTLLEGAEARHPICVCRGEGRWRQFESDDGSEGREAVVYERDGEVEGHLLYRQKAGGGETSRTLEVTELVAETLRARAGLLSFAAAYDPEDWSVDHAVPRGEPLHPYLESSHVEAKVRPGMMLRLVDVEGALGYLRRAPGEQLVLEVADDGIPENAGEYTLGGSVARGVARGAESAERVSLDVRQLSQLYAGYLSAGQLARHGLLKGSPRALQELEALFPAGDPWVFPLDHF